ncbi:MAG: hypothetical protein U0074_00160 [Kouleothrix sp.]
MLKEKVRAAKFVVAISEYNKNLITKYAAKRCAIKSRLCIVVSIRGYFQPRQKPAGQAPFTIVCVGSLEEKGQTYSGGSMQDIKTAWAGVCMPFDWRWRFHARRLRRKLAAMAWPML